MNDEAEAGAESVGVPASMADLFFTLIAVVVLMLLALAPAIRTPGALAPGREPPWSADLRVDGQKPFVLVAEHGGLRLPKPSERLVAPNAILTDGVLKDGLRRAGAEGSPLLLLVTSGGGEAAFLFDALAGSLAIPTVNQIRLDRACTFVASAEAKRFCDPDGWNDAP